ncbi:uncharacterized protein LOC130261381 isoform X1 [Oenanthe melanoleuca]|uniref:uncharacterized protein LOC130261381 isoform X1 n=1 Tax=Oenanthe melanoleuca TaxID=2939378 RepID=UPI0024C19851|nr:uncharacterized protein LOC130261381 isoform X1 [Oenanthe melanoleuca]
MPASVPKKAVTDREEEMKVDKQIHAKKNMKVKRGKTGEEEMEVDVKEKMKEVMEVGEIEKMLYGIPASFRLHQHAGEHKYEDYSTFSCCFHFLTQISPKSVTIGPSQSLTFTQTHSDSILAGFWC